MEFSVWPRAKALPGGEHIGNQIIGGCHGRGGRWVGVGTVDDKMENKLWNALSKADWMLK